jgi:hypothetical protein
LEFWELFAFSLELHVADGSSETVLERNPLGYEKFCDIDVIFLKGTKFMQCTKVTGTILILVEFKVVYQAIPAATCSFFF